MGLLCVCSRPELRGRFARKKSFYRMGQHADKEPKPFTGALPLAALPTKALSLTTCLDKSTTEDIAPSPWAAALRNSLQATTGRHRRLQQARRLLLWRRQRLGASERESGAEG